ARDRRPGRRGDGAGRARAGGRGGVPRAAAAQRAAGGARARQAGGAGGARQRPAEGVRRAARPRDGGRRATGRARGRGRGPAGGRGRASHDGTVRAPARAAYPGPPGTVSREALAAAGPEIERVPPATLRDVVLSVQEGRRERALAPVENAREGGVDPVLDGL